MKKKILITLLTSLLFCSLTSCTQEKVSLTYGTYIEQDLSSLVTINSSDLYSRTSVNNEVFLLATYQESYSEDCLCWTSFQHAIVNYINIYHEKVYLYNTLEDEKTAKDLKIEQYEDSTPALYIFNGTKQLAKFSYKESKDKAIFTDKEAEAMYESVHKYVSKPYICEVDDDFLSKKLRKKEEAVVMFIRRSCTDCSYALNNVLIPYFYEHSFWKEIWYFDLDDYYKLSKDQSASLEEQSKYQQMKDKYGLSEKNGSLFGYSTGFVPTTQYYKNGVLTDASVFFNDSVSQNDDGSFYISRSFYSEERLTSLSYCKNVKNNVLAGMQLDKEEVLSTKTGYLYWDQEKAAAYHRPLLQAFLDFYL